jgi:hypothetical protein
MLRDEADLRSQANSEEANLERGLDIALEILAREDLR